MNVYNSIIPSRSRFTVKFDNDFQEIEDKLMSIKTSNDHIRNKLHKVTSSLQAIQKCLGRGHFIPKSILRKKCPPAKSALIVKENLAEYCDKIQNDCQRESSDQDRPDYSIQNLLEEKRYPFQRRFGRSWSVSDSGSKSEIDIEEFPSYQKQTPELYGSNRSINSIFKLHQTLNSSAKIRNKSGSLTNLGERNYNSVKIYPLFQSQDKYYKPIRPNSLFISQREAAQIIDVKNARNNFKSSMKQGTHSTQSLDKYLSSISSVQDKKLRSEKAAEAIDSCILLMMNLINE